MGQTPSLHIVLFEPEIPQNTGAVGRTCVGIDAKLWLVRPIGFQLNDHYLKRAGLDYWSYLNWEIADNWERLLTRLSEETGQNPPKIWFFTKKAQIEYTQVQYKTGDILLFGSESRGAPDFIHKHCSETALRIPIAEQARCLNVSVSVGIAAFEALRQIRTN